MQQIIQKNYFKHKTADASIYQIDIKVTTLLKIALDFLMSFMLIAHLDMIGYDVVVLL